MGSQISPSTINSSTQINPSYWNIKSRHKNSINIRTHPTLGTQIIQQQFQVPSQQEYQQLENIYQMREGHLYLIATVAFVTSQTKQYCGRSYRGSIFYQRLLTTLQKIRDIPFPDFLHFYAVGLKGFQILFKKFGYFQVLQQMFHINNNGRVKVWIDKDIRKVQPAIYLKDVSGSQQDMVSKIIYLIQQNSDSCPQTIQLKQYFLVKGGKTSFVGALGTLRQYCRDKSMVIPQKLECLDHVNYSQYAHLFDDYYVPSDNQKCLNQGGYVGNVIQYKTGFSNQNINNNSNIYTYQNNSNNFTTNQQNHFNPNKHSSIIINGKRSVSLPNNKNSHYNQRPPLNNNNINNNFVYHNHNQNQYQQQVYHYPVINPSQNYMNQQVQSRQKLQQKHFITSYPIPHQNIQTSIVIERQNRASSLKKQQNNHQSISQLRGSNSLHSLQSISNKNKQIGSGIYVTQNQNNNKNSTVSLGMIKNSSADNIHKITNTQNIIQLNRNANSYKRNQRQRIISSNSHQSGINNNRNIFFNNGINNQKDHNLSFNMQQKNQQKYQRNKQNFQQIQTPLSPSFNKLNSMNNTSNNYEKNYSYVQQFQIPKNESFLQNKNQNNNNFNNINPIHFNQTFGSKNNQLSSSQSNQNKNTSTLKKKTVAKSQFYRKKQNQQIKNQEKNQQIQIKQNNKQYFQNKMISTNSNKSINQNKPFDQITENGYQKQKSQAQKSKTTKATVQTSNPYQYKNQNHFKNTYQFESEKQEKKQKNSEGLFGSTQLRYDKSDGSYVYQDLWQQYLKQKQEKQARKRKQTQTSLQKYMTKQIVNKDHQRNISKQSSSSKKVNTLQTININSQNELVLNSASQNNFQSPFSKKKIQSPTSYFKSNAKSIPVYEPISQKNEQFSNNNNSSKNKLNIAQAYDYVKQTSRSQIQNQRDHFIDAKYDNTLIPTPRRQLAKINKNIQQWTLDRNKEEQNDLMKDTNKNKYEKNQLDIYQQLVNKAYSLRKNPSILLSPSQSNNSFVPLDVSPRIIPSNKNVIKQNVQNFNLRSHLQSNSSQVQSRFEITPRSTNFGSSNNLANNRGYKADIDDDILADLNKLRQKKQNKH